MSATVTHLPSAGSSSSGGSDQQLAKVFRAVDEVRKLYGLVARIGRVA